MVNERNHHRRLDHWAPPVPRLAARPHPEVLTVDKAIKDLMDRAVRRGELSPLDELCSGARMRWCSDNRHLVPGTPQMPPVAAGGRQEWWAKHGKQIAEAAEKALAEAWEAYVAQIHRDAEVILRPWVAKVAAENGGKFPAVQWTDLGGIVSPLSLALDCPKLPRPTRPILRRLIEEKGASVVPYIPGQDNSEDNPSDPWGWRVE